MQADFNPVAKVSGAPVTPFIYEISNYHVLVCGTNGIPPGTPPGPLVDKIRSETPAAVQVVDSDYVFGVQHARGICAVAIEAKKRGVMISKRLETEVLIRLALTAQISEAITRLGIKPGKPACFIAISSDGKEILKFGQRLASEELGGGVDNSSLAPSPRKMLAIISLHGWKKKQGGDIFTVKCFGDFMCERAAIMVR
ncbi:MAG: KEOPS complex subunit Cgi121 [Nitrososphaera sp.]|jgi:hypothetical protein